MELCEVESPFDNGDIEFDEWYFGVGRVRGKRGRGAGGKIPVFGILKKGDKIYTQIVKSCSTIKELLPIIKSKTTPTEEANQNDFFKFNSRDGLLESIIK